MNISKVLLAGCLTGMSFICASAQPLGSSEQDKALELLRQKIAEERAKSSLKPEPRAAMPAAMGGEKMSPAEAPAAQPADPASYQKALDAVRASIANSRQTVKTTAATAPATAPSAPAPMASPETNTKALNAVRAALSAQRQAAMPVSTPSRAEAPRASTSAPVKEEVAPVVASPAAPPAAPAVTSQPVGPKSKQHRLMELLQLYKTDQITPLEYHEQRAKIVAEP